ncbi:hypothetical protein BC831DRAFT_447423, partial [Entophlyctis helioformis]
FPGMPGMGGMPGMPGMGDPAGLQQLMNNPMMAQMVGQMMSNPQFMDAMVASNPQLASMMTPELRQIMQSDTFRNMMANPQFIQMMMQMQGGAGGMPGGMPGMGAFGSPTGAGAGAGAQTEPTAAGFPPLPLFDPAMMQMLMASRGMGAGAGAGAGSFPGLGALGGGAPAAPAGPPEEVYQVQLRQLQEMGFYDAAENVRALTLCGGNVDAAIDYLFTQRR